MANNDDDYFFHLISSLGNFNQIYKSFLRLNRQNIRSQHLTSKKVGQKKFFFPVFLLTIV